MGSLMPKVERTPNRLYVLELNIVRPLCLAAQGSSAAWRWHARYGHLNFKGSDDWPTATWSVGCLSLIRWIKFVTAVSQGSNDDTHS
jgi:hypothetical protein